jgi:hypothetical protein
MGAGDAGLLSRGMELVAVRRSAGSVCFAAAGEQ